MPIDRICAIILISSVPKRSSEGPHCSTAGLSVITSKASSSDGAKGGGDEDEIDNTGRSLVLILSDRRVSRVMLVAALAHCKKVTASKERSATYPGYKMVLEVLEAFVYKGERRWCANRKCLKLWGDADDKLYYCHCKQVGYCTDKAKKCQKEHWDEHKHDCKPLRACRKREEAEKKAKDKAKAKDKGKAKDKQRPA